MPRNPTLYLPSSPTSHVGRALGPGAYGGSSPGCLFLHPNSESFLWEGAHWLTPTWGSSKSQFLSQGMFLLPQDLPKGRRRHSHPHVTLMPPRALGSPLHSVSQRTP